MSLQFEVTLNSNPTADEKREAILENPVFGANLTDHQVVITWEKDKGTLLPEVRLSSRPQWLSGSLAEEVSVG